MTSWGLTSKKADEVEKYEEEPGTILNSSQNISNSPKNEEFLDEEEQTGQMNQLTLRPGWKHSSSHPLDNLISALNSGMQNQKQEIWFFYQLLSQSLSLRM